MYYEETHTIEGQPLAEGYHPLPGYRERIQA